MKFDTQLKKTMGDFRLDCNFTITNPKTGIYGPSGSGKSTIVQLLAGLITPDKGHIYLDNNCFFDSSKAINTKPDQRNLGVVFQHAHLFPHMSVKQNVLYGYNRTTKENRLIDPEDIFSTFEIKSLLKRDIDTLSGGERQRVALARTVLTCPSLILMDEPLNGLDEELKLHIIPYLNRIFTQYKIPLIFISHSLMEMRMMTDEVLVMEQGTIRQQMATEAFAKTSWASERRGYINLIQLGRPSQYQDLFAYRWGENTLILTEEGTGEENLFELDARDIILFKRHPEATSARNLLHCRVSSLYTLGNRVRLELDCGTRQFTAQIVPESLRELGIEVGCEVVAAIKASSFTKVF